MAVWRVCTEVPHKFRDTLKALATTFAGTALALDPRQARNHEGNPPSKQLSDSQDPFSLRIHHFSDVAKAQVFPFSPIAFFFIQHKLGIGTYSIYSIAPFSIMVFDKLVRFEHNGEVSYGNLVGSSDSGFQVTRLEGGIREGFRSAGDEIIHVEKVRIL